MDRKTFNEFVSSEALARWFEAGRPSGGSSNKVCVFEEGGRWVTVMTDERAAVLDGSHRTFDAESEALIDALDALRMLKSILT